MLQVQHVRETVQWKSNRIDHLRGPMPQRQKRLILNPDYLEDERLPQVERLRLLPEIFSKNVRQKELEKLARHYSSLLDGGSADHAVICGPTGSGKTISLIHFFTTLRVIAQKEGKPIHWRYVDLSAQNTCFAALNRIAAALDASKIYWKGVSTEMMFGQIQKGLNRFEGNMIIQLDEIDQVKYDRDILMTFLTKTLPRLVNVRLHYIFTTNRIDWDKHLDGRILSCFRRSDYIFRAYDAYEIEEILNLRIDRSLDRARVEESSIKLIAAIASRESGDARKAVELLAKSASLADQQGEKLTEAIVKEAEVLLEKEKTEGMIDSLPYQHKIALTACYVLLLQKNKIYSSDAYNSYEQIALSSGIATQPLSARRFNDILNAFETYGLIGSITRSLGRYGMRRQMYNIIGSTQLKTLYNRLCKMIRYENA
jgi:cell division control protein 6